MMKLLVCESVSPGMRDEERTVCVRDAVTGNRSFIRVETDYLTMHDGKYYVPVGVVQDEPHQGFALIELTQPTDGGSARLWVRRTDFLASQKVAT